MSVSVSLWVMSLCEGLHRGLGVGFCVHACGGMSGLPDVDASDCLPGRNLMCLWDFSQGLTDLKSHYCLPLCGSV